RERKPARRPRTLYPEYLITSKAVSSAVRQPVPTEFAFRTLDQVGAFRAGHRSPTRSLLGRCLTWFRRASALYRDRLRCWHHFGIVLARDLLELEKDSRGQIVDIT